MSNPYFKTLYNLIEPAGELSLKLLKNSNPQLKGDRSVITDADKAISQMVRVQLAEYLTSPDHILIDEEDPNVNDYFNQEKLNKMPYIWCMDPIDGTRLYASKIPTYGISIGLIKDLKPWLGIVYFPFLRELFYCDGEEAYFVRNAFTSAEEKQKIIPLDIDINYKTVFLMDDLIFRDYDWDYKFCQPMMQACAVVDLCWPAIGRACGGIFHSNLWDFAGSWPIFQKAGLNLRSINTGEILDRLDVKFFAHPRRPWKTRDYQILSSERNFSLLKNNLTIRTQE